MGERLSLLFLAARLSYHHTTGNEQRRKIIDKLHKSINPSTKSSLHADGTYSARLSVHMSLLSRRNALSAKKEEITYVFPPNATWNKLRVRVHLLFRQCDICFRQFSIVLSRFAVCTDDFISACNLTRDRRLKSLYLVTQLVGGHPKYRDLHYDAPPSPDQLRFLEDNDISK